jgi:hypothetical protein
MARLLGLENIGRAVSKHNSFKAEIDTFYLGERHKISGPPRGQNEQHAQHDLALIRASALGSAARLEGLQAMRMESLRLQEEAKATRKPQGCIEEGAAYSTRACIQYWDEVGKHAVRGPSRTGRRRAKADLTKLREASQGHDTWEQQIPQRLSVQLPL